MGMNLDYCPQCGNLYVINRLRLCPNCLQEYERNYEKCVEYLRNNKMASISELSEATEVPEKQILRFIRDGRISISSAPNLAYPCEVCGTPVQGGKICERCRQRLSRDIQHHFEDERRREQKPPTRDSHAYNISDRLENRRKDT